MFVGLVVFWLTESWVSCESAEMFFVYWVLDHAEFKYDHQNGVRRVKTDQKCSRKSNFSPELGLDLEKSSGEKNTFREVDWAKNCFSGSMFRRKNTFPLKT